MRPISRNDFAIAIICTLPLEAEAVEALFDETYDRFGRYYGKQLGDANSYINGRIRNHNVVLCCVPRTEKGAASIASSLRVSYTGIELVLIVGICGGAPSTPNNREVYLGDVVIGDAVLNYTFGQRYPGGLPQKAGVKYTLGRPSQEIRTLLDGLSGDNACKEFQNQIQQYVHTLQQASKKWHHPQINDALFKASYLHKHYGNASSTGCCCLENDSPDNICEAALKKDCDDLGCDKSQVIRCREPLEAAKVSVHIGAVASTDTVVKSGRNRDAIASTDEVIAFETEGARIRDDVPCLIIKGICDYADSHRSISWQAYAAVTGASAAKAFLEYWGPRNEGG
jgi:nucleoside phosphorylase